jgi:REP element-mobilizing transposase RayT
MARELRIAFAGAVYHVMSRGNERNPIFKKDADRILFVDTLRESAEIGGVEVIAYVLMDNHYHMIIGTPNGNISDFMRHLNLTYTVRFNKNYGRSGHLFQGRFKGIIIEEDPYLMVLSRYIHLNPVREKVWEGRRIKEKLVYLKRYQWSSLCGYLDKKERVSWISYEKVLHYFGRDDDSSRRIYSDYISDGLKTEISNPFTDIKSQVILGSEGFVDKIRGYLNKGAKIREVPALRSLKKVLSIEEVLNEIAVFFNIEKEKLISKQAKGLRQIAMEMVYRYTSSNQETAGEIFGVDYSTVSQNRRRLGIQLKNDSKLREDFGKINEKLNELSNQKI